MIDVIRNIGCKSPIVGTVLEQIHDRHCCIGKSMDKKSLQDPLGIVTGPTKSGDIHHGFVNDFANIAKENPRPS